MTKNWRAMAQAQGFDLSAAEWERVAPSLDALDQAFRPLVAPITAGAEPAFRFCAEEDAE